MRSVRAGFLVACALATLCPPAQADPRPSQDDVAEAREAVRDKNKALGSAAARLASAQGELDRLAAETERLVEAYNGELVRMAAARQTADAARARLTGAESEVATARTAVAVIAAETYGGFDLSKPMMTVLLDGGGDSDTLHRASMLEQMSGERAMTLERLRQAEEVAAIFRTQADQALGAQRSATARAETLKEAAERATRVQERETARLMREKRSLTKQVDAARSRAERLARERAAARVRTSFRAGAVPVRGSSGGDIAANWVLTQLGKPYVWAADGPASYDCSGLTMRAWEQAGVRIDHWTGTQWTSGPHVPMSQLRRGDLLFFGRITSDPGTIHHVGMYIGRGLMVHAPQTGDVVRIASMWRSDLVGATRPS
ncbi:C40 family peptidase [Nonomuraea longicatena]|uniref:NlpC/P60 family protein n=1 Tax=Nonomuraea longicatena TaxID=83682 RepID=A0ABP4BIA0_9ACTN